MTEFEKKLIRLKEQLGVAQDKEIAAILGMESRAFTARKARGAFPEDKVRALVVDYPNLDVRYVITGMRDSAALKFAVQANIEMQKQAQRYQEIYGVKEGAGKYASDDEDELLRIFRAANAAGKSVILATARAIEQNK